MNEGNKTYEWDGEKYRKDELSSLHVASAEPSWYAHHLPFS